MTSNENVTINIKLLGYNDIVIPLHVSINFKPSKPVDNSVHNTTVNNYFGYGLNEDDIKKLQSDVQRALEVSVKDEVSVLTDATATISSFRPSGSLTMTKHTNNPTAEELKLVQEARGNKPYDSIFDVNIDYDENGNVTGISWTES